MTSNPMRGLTLALFLSVSASSLALPANAQPQPPDYRQWTNGPWSNQNFFPISVWWQTANETGHSGRYPTLAAAAEATGINIFLGQGSDWPETYGADQGELEAVKAHGLYMIGGISVPWQENKSAHSVSSILALANAIGARSNLIGYNAGDEPSCEPAAGHPSPGSVPTIVAAIQGFDPTRLVTFNETDWMVQPQWQTHPPQCLDWDQAALQATPVASFDNYPATTPYVAWQLGVTGTDYNRVSNDALWVQGLSVQATLHYARPGQPIWAFVESGSDDLGAAESNNSMGASVSGNVLSPTGAQRFGSSWIGLSVNGLGLPSNTVIQGITDPMHAVLTHKGSGTGTVTITGGINDSDCVAAVNLCVVNGNEYRATPAQVNAEAWMSVINGANGIEWSCQDALSYSFCLGDSAAAGTAATAAQQNLTYVNQSLTRRAGMLNAPTLGLCSMRSLNYLTGTATVTSLCINGILSMRALNPDVPGSAMAKSWKGKTFLFAQPAGAGAGRFTFTMGGLPGRTATVVYDSNQHYDVANSGYGRHFTLDPLGSFTDTFGAHGDDYQVKIYSID